MVQVSITANILFYLFLFLRYTTILMDYYCLIHEIEEHYNGKVAHYKKVIYSPGKMFWNNICYHNESKFFMQKANYKTLLKLRSLEFVKEYELAEFGE